VIYWELIWAFLQIGMFAFGAAYGTIPLIRDAVLSHNWMSEEMFTYFVAVCESTPGPIIVNLATYIGSSQAGFWGALLATISVVLPSFIVILIVASVMKNFINNKYIQSVIKGIKPCIIGMILAMGVYMIISNVLLTTSQISFDWSAMLITGILLAISFAYQKIKLKDFPPILLIIFSAGMGIVIYAF